MRTVSQCPINFDRYMENKMNNTIQRRLKRERKIKNMLWLFLAGVVALFIFSCSSDDEDNCNCKGKFISDEGYISYVNTELNCDSQYPFHPIIREGKFVECVTVDY